MESEVEQDMAFHEIFLDNAGGSADGWIYLDDLAKLGSKFYVLQGDFSGKVLNRNYSQVTKDILRFSQQDHVLSSL